MRASRLLAGIVACLTAGCVHEFRYDTALTIVPYQIQPSGRIIVAIELNGDGPFTFALDTASSGSFVFSEAAEQLGLEPIAGAVANVRGAIAAGRFPIVAIDRFELGTEVHRGVRLTMLPGDTFATRTIDGVLGADFMRRYAIGFSVRDNLLRFYAPETVADRVYQGFASIELEPVRVGVSDEPLYLFDIEIADRSLPALFDLGAGVNLMNTATADYLDLATTRREEAVEFSDAVESREVLARFGTQAVSTGQVDWRNEIFMISDLEVFETLGYADEPLAILGSGLFTQRDFVIDFVRNRLLIQTSRPELEAD